MSLPKIFVFCNSCAPQWHSMLALSEDGECLAGHLCSSHGWAAHDMGIHPDGWKRDLYATKYPDGFEVVWVEDAGAPEGEFLAAIEKAKARSAANREAEATAVAP
jgi:hypothetical protein